MRSVLIFSLLLSNFFQIRCNLTEIVDLTWDFSNETVYWPGVTPFAYTKIVGTYHELGFWYAANEFCAGEHGGTHFDAPYHFNKEGWKVAEVPISRLIANGATVDVSNNGTKTLLTQHLEDWVHENGQFDDNTVLLVKFGWSQYYNNRTKYIGLDPEGNLNFPGVSAAAANWIAQSGKIVGVGLDTPSVDPGSVKDLSAHRILAKKQIYIMENVKILGELPAKAYTLLALPMKLKEGTGAPLRLLAVPKISL